MLKIEGFEGKLGNPVVAAPKVEKAAEKTVVQTSARPSTSFKIKEALSALNEQKPAEVKEQEAKYEKIKSHDAIDEQKVRDAIRHYVENCHPDPIVAVALESHQPIVSGDQIRIFVDNQIQMEKLHAIQMHFSHVLMKTLNNGFLSFDFQLFDSNKTTEVKKLYTAEEKFNRFVEINPVVAELKKIFGLELE